MISKRISAVQEFINRYGLKNYLTYRKSKAKGEQLTSLKLPEYEHEIWWRIQTTDLNTLYEIFICNEYNIPFNGRPKNIIDGGGNVGYSAVYFANKYPDANIFVIEPEKQNFELLCKNNKHFKNVVPINAALWNKTSELTVVDSGCGEWGFMTQETASDTAKEVNRIQSITINDIMKQNNWKQIDILKIDIEGAEKELFEDNCDWLKSVRMVIIELHDRKKAGTAQAFFSTLTKVGISYDFDVKGESIIIINRNPQNVDQYN